jgi:hypothetical protein
MDQMENHGSYDKDSLFILTAADRRHRTWRLALSAWRPMINWFTGSASATLTLRRNSRCGRSEAGRRAQHWGPLARRPQVQSALLAALRRGVAAKGDFLFFLTKEPQRISFPLFFLYNSGLGQSHKIGTKSHNQRTKRPGSATRKGQRPQKGDAGVL